MFKNEKNSDEGNSILDLHIYLPGFRTPLEQEINRLFFEPLETRDAILDMLRNGFTAD